MPPVDQGRIAAELYDGVIAISVYEARRGALALLIELRREELRRPPDDASGKRPA